MTEGVEGVGGPGTALFAGLGSNFGCDICLFHEEPELSGEAISGADGFASEVWEDELRLGRLPCLLRQPLFHFGVEGNFNKPFGFSLTKADGFSLQIDRGPFEIGEIASPATGVVSRKDETLPFPVGYCEELRDILRGEDSLFNCIDRDHLNGFRGVAWNQPWRRATLRGVRRILMATFAVAAARPSERS